MSSNFSVVLLYSFFCVYCVKIYAKVEVLNFRIRHLKKKNENKNELKTQKMESKIQLMTPGYILFFIFDVPCLTVDKRFNKNKISLMSW